MLAKVKAYWDAHGTKILAGVSGSIVALSGAGVIPDRHLKYYMAVSNLAVFWRGFVNSRNLP
jgi:hypothetical protein